MDNSIESTSSGVGVPIGSAVIVYGKIEAYGVDGSSRSLQPNSPVFFNDRIVTGGNGMVSIVFNDSAKTQLDVGRMSDLVIDEDVYQPDENVDLQSAVAEALEVQEALLAGELDPTVELDPPAAGQAGAAPADDGGGNSIVKFELTAEEVTPESGAETVGIVGGFIDPDPVVIEPVPLFVQAAFAAPSVAVSTTGEPEVEIPETEEPVFFSINRVVEEEEMSRWKGDYSDGNPDSNDFPVDDTQPNASVLTGDLNTLVTNFGGSLEFSLQLPAGLPQILSQGRDVTYRVDTGLTSSTLKGLTNMGTPDEQVVLSLEVEMSGFYTYTQYDQLDHVPPPAGVKADENFQLMIQGGTVAAVDALKLGGAIVATSGSSVFTFSPEALVFTVVDDIPIFAQDYEYTPNFQDGVARVSPGLFQETLRVQEDALSQDVLLQNPNNNPDVDNSLGNPDDTGWYGDTDSAGTGSLSFMVKVGADDPLTWGLRPVDFAAADEGTQSGIFYGGVSQNGLTSHGELIEYRFEYDPTSPEDKLIAFTASNPNVFELTLTKNSGVATFNLQAALDHDTSILSEAGDDGELCINELGKFVRAMDYDKDYLELTDNLRIVVENDVPEVVVTQTTYYVSEYAGYDNAVGYYFIDDLSQMSGSTIIVPHTNISDNSQVSPQVFYDDAGQIVGAAPWHHGYTKGLEVDVPYGAKFYLIANGGTGSDNGIFYMDSGFDTPTTGTGFSTHFTDQWVAIDATLNTPDHTIDNIPMYGGEVRIEDLRFGDADFNDAVLRVERGAVVSEASLTAADVEPGDDVGTGTEPFPLHDTIVATGNFFYDENNTSAGIQFKPGADVELTLNVQSLGIPTYSAQGSIGAIGEITITQGATLQPGADLMIAGEAGILEIFNNGDWKYTLDNNTVKNPDNDKGGHDQQDGDHDRYAADQVQEVFAITAMDFDGDWVSADFIININDDGPVAESPAEKGILIDEAGNSLVADLNILFGADGADIETGVVITPYTPEGSEEGQLVTSGSVYNYNGWEIEWIDNQDGTWTAHNSAQEGGDSAFLTVSPEKIGGKFTGNYEVQQHNALIMDEPTEQSPEEQLRVEASPPEIRCVKGDPEFDFLAEVTDGDGDTALTTFTVEVSLDNEVIGSAADEVISGSSDGDDIYGGDGNDTILGGAGEDHLFGEGGEDTIDGGPGEDVIVGGDDPDTVYGGSGSDTVIGDSGDPLTDDNSEDTFDQQEVNTEVTDYDSAEDTIDTLIPPIV